ncbi:hypothetical protein [Tenuibacillus multivorans]|uniref:ABC-2 family transporter protein n=1 Tax=Tenuibacillus multivorans TaxID=237069 RepID=A0A1G9YJP3_9BACI|nr:hypothetical protein [Tenuibacillus multivorans]GEL78499.1 hypothetical protein TMU01_27340 [Tenuibacillus multivorans]SDN08711.1 hypothetical protein SAMN05216498_1413 [Tenuibacillus multivorans]
MNYYLKHEFKLILKSKKNLLFIAFIAIILLTYILLMLPKEEHVETVEPEEIKRDLDQVFAQQELRRESGQTYYNRYTGTSYYALRESYYHLHNKILTSIDDDNYRRFTHLRLYYLLGNPRSFISSAEGYEQSPYPGKDKLHLYYQTLLRYQSYLDQDQLITYPMIVEKTTLQKLQELLLSSLTYLIIFMAIYFSCDMLVRDKQYQSLTQGLPMSWYRTINLKSLVAFMFTLLTIVGFSLIGAIIISLQYGFGHFNLPIPIKTDLYGYSLEAYNTMSMGEFSLKSVSFIPLLIFLFIRFNALLSLLVRNTWLVLSVSTIILLSEFIYYDRTVKELFGLDLSYFPQTYFDFGKVVANEKNYLFNVETITYSQGLIVIFITIIIVEILLYTMTKLITKRKFYQS